MFVNGWMNGEHQHKNMHIYRLLELERSRARSFVVQYSINGYAKVVKVR